MRAGADVRPLAASLPLLAASVLASQDVGRLGLQRPSAVDPQPPESAAHPAPAGAGHAAAAATAAAAAASTSAAAATAAVGGAARPPTAASRLVTAAAVGLLSLANSFATDVLVCILQCNHCLKAPLCMRHMWRPHRAGRRGEAAGLSPTTCQSKPRTSLSYASERTQHVFLCSLVAWRHSTVPTMLSAGLGARFVAADSPAVKGSLLSQKGYIAAQSTSRKSSEWRRPPAAGLQLVQATSAVVDIDRNTRRQQAAPAASDLQASVCCCCSARGVALAKSLGMRAKGVQASRASSGGGTVVPSESCLSGSLLVPGLKAWNPGKLHPRSNSPRRGATLPKNAAALTAAAARPPARRCCSLAPPSPRAAVPCRPSSTACWTPQPLWSSRRRAR